MPTFRNCGMISTMNFFAENIKFLMWDKKSDLAFGNLSFAEYPMAFARRIGLDEERFIRILRGTESPRADERNKICQGLALSEEEQIALDAALFFDPNLETIKKEFFRLNFARLMSRLEHGRKEDVAKALSVDVSTLTRWRNGTAYPGLEKRERLAELFGLESERDLTEGYLFYELEPATVREKRDEVESALRRMDDRVFGILYPALIRLVGGGR